MDDKCGELVESIGVANRLGYQEVGVASGWNLWVWLVSVVVRRYIIDILIIIIIFPYSTCISSFFGSIIPISLFIKKMFFHSCRLKGCTVLPTAIYIVYNFTYCGKFFSTLFTNHILLATENTHTC